MKKVKAIVALAGALTCGEALADGNELLEACEHAISNKDSDSPASAGYCLGVIYGVASTMTTMNQYMLPKERTCFPGPFKNVQGARIVVKYLESHPASLHRGGAFLAMAAFQNAYPCR